MTPMLTSSPPTVHSDVPHTGGHTAYTLRAPSQLKICKSKRSLPFILLLATLPPQRAHLEEKPSCLRPATISFHKRVKKGFRGTAPARCGVTVGRCQLLLLTKRTINKLSVFFAGPASSVLHHAAHSQLPWGSTEPLVTFLTFFMFSITPDVVTTDSISRSSSS